MEWFQSRGFISVVVKDVVMWRKRDIGHNGQLVTLTVSDLDGIEFVRERWFAMSGWRLG